MYLNPNQPYNLGHYPRMAFAKEGAEKYKTGTSRVVQRLRLLASTAGDMQNQDSVSRDMAKKTHRKTEAIL